MPTELISRDDADALIPEEVASDIIRALPSRSVAVNRFRTVRMGRGQQRLPVLQTLPQAYFVGGDTGLKRTTKLQWGNRFLNAEEIAVIVPIPESVLDDAAFDLWTESLPDIVNAVSARLDGAVLFGEARPESWPVGIVPAAAGAGNEYLRGSVVDQDVAEDVNQVMAFVEEDGFEVNGHVGRVRMKSTLRGLRGTDGHPIFIPRLPDGTPGTLYGEEIDFVNNGSWVNEAADLISGDWGQAILGIRQDISWRVFTEGVISDDDGNVVLNLMQQDSAALRLTFRVAFEVANSITRLQPVEGERYPFGVLRPADFTS